MALDKTLKGALVKAAVGFLDEAFRANWVEKVGKTQFSNLGGVCQAAEHPEEIELYIRYQSGRNIWPLEFGKHLVEALQKAVTSVDAKAEVTVEMWRHYAAYLSRQFTYENAVQKAKMRTRA